MSWAEQAKCAGRDPWAYEKIPSHIVADRWRRAKVTEWCEQCPVRSHCDAEIETVPEHQRHGLWAGRWYGVPDTRTSWSIDGRNVISDRPITEATARKMLGDVDRLAS
ncbi:MAG: WhiB family transcriptional regulator [Phycicoccus sp.]